MDVRIAPAPEGRHDRPWRLAWAAALAVSVAIGLAVPSAPGDESGAMAEVIRRRWLEPGVAWDVAERGDTAFIAASGSFVSMDISDPARPTILDTIPLEPNRGQRMVIDRDTAWIADGDWALIGVDIGDPRALRYRGVLIDPIDYAMDVALSDSHAVLVRRLGLAIVDISKPDEPRILATLPEVLAGRVAAHGSLVAAVGHEGEFWLVDASAPARPRVLAHVTGGEAASAAFAGGRLHIGTRHASVVSWDISDPAAPRALTERVIQRTWRSPITDMQEVDGELWVVDHASGLTALGLPLSTDGPTLWQYSLRTGTHAVSGRRDRILVVDAYEGLHVLDAGGGADAVRRGRWRFGVAKQVRVRGQLAYLAGPDLHVMDLSQPSMLRELGRLVVPGVATDLWLLGETALVIGSGLSLVDIRDPVRPLLLDHVELPTSPRGIVEQDGLVYVVGHGNGGVTVVEVLDGTRLQVVETVPAPAGHQLAVGGGLLAVAADFDGLHVFDLSDPRLPRPVGTFAPAGLVYDVEIDSDRVATVAVDHSPWPQHRDQPEHGLHVVDLVEPSSPRRMSFSPGFFHHLNVINRTAYLSGYGPSVIDLTDPLIPRPRASVWTQSPTYGIAVAGHELLVASGDYGLIRYSLTSAGATAYLPSVRGRSR